MFVCFSGFFYEIGNRAGRSVGVDLSLNAHCARE